MRTLYFFIMVFSTGLLHSQQGWMLGGGPTLELDEQLFGANARLFYGLNEKVCFGPEVAFYPYQEIDDEYELQIVDLNANIHYIFELSHSFAFYPLGGVNYTIERERLLEESEEVKTENDFGLNYGGGFHLNLGSFFAFAEFKGILGSLNDDFVTIGVIFPISGNEDKNHHNE